MSITRKTAMVTGSSSGIGIGFGAACALLEAGWNVVINGRDADRLRHAVKRLGHCDRVASVVGSTALRTTGEAMAALARDQFGAIDLLVNNAGEFAAKPFLEVTEQDLDRALEVNLKGTYLTTQAAVREMVARGRGGSIVNIGTVLAHHGMSWVHRSAPLVSKGGVHALTIALAAELAPAGIRVNCVAPGFTRTPLMNGANEPKLAATALLGRVGEVNDIAHAILYLAEASFVTGQMLHVDGGYVGGRR